MSINLPGSLQRMAAIMMKEIRQLSRDRITFGMVVMIPVIQLLLFGYATNSNVRHIPIAAVDQSHSVIGREIVRSVQATQVVALRHSYLTPQEAEQAITNGLVRATLILPRDLTQRMVKHQPLDQWVIDGSDAVISSTLLQLAAMPLALNPYYQQAARKTFHAALFFNPERRSAVNTVTGLLAVILTMTMILFTSAAIVRERERWNLELLITTPVRSFDLCWPR